MPLARRGDEGIVSQLAALGVEVPHQKQTGALFDRTGKELAVLVPEQILLFLQIPGKLLFGNAQLLGGGADVGAVRRVNKGVVILRFWEGKPETAGQLPVSLRRRFRYSGTASGCASSASNRLSVIYAPCLRMEGMTSWVIQRLKAFASGFLEQRIK